MLVFWKAYIADRDSELRSSGHWTLHVRRAADVLVYPSREAESAFAKVLDWIEDYFVDERSVHIWNCWAKVLPKMAREPLAARNELHGIVRRQVSRAWRNHLLIHARVAACEAQPPDSLERRILRYQPRFVRNASAALPRVLAASRARRAWGLIEPQLSKADRRQLLTWARLLAPSVRVDVRDVTLP